MPVGDIVLCCRVFCIGWPSARLKTRHAHRNTHASAQEVGTTDDLGPRRLERADVQNHYTEHPKFGNATTNITLLHDGVDFIKRKWIGMFAHHMSLGIGGVLPLQVILTDLTC